MYNPVLMEKARYTGSTVMFSHASTRNAQTRAGSDFLSSVIVFYGVTGRYLTDPRLLLSTEHGGRHIRLELSSGTHRNPFFFLISQCRKRPKCTGNSCCRSQGGKDKKNTSGSSPRPLPRSSRTYVTCRCTPSTPWSSSTTCVLTRAHV